MVWLGDIQCPVDFVVGTATIKVRECAGLQRHQVFRLVQAAGGDLEVRVAGVPFATGEVVVRDDSTSLRIGRVLGPAGPSQI
ncbi:MAG TPA: FliM/FliN family flagellar motor C-terminal domain-containing protein [Vicinamibacterales bacterium]|nr:FliM/FliN family flagellar motor C-terminal domain-containing protein [Vicinamibacterales bacterium]